MHALQIQIAGWFIVGFFVWLIVGFVLCRFGGEDVFEVGVFVKDFEIGIFRHPFEVVETQLDRFRKIFDGLFSVLFTKRFTVGKIGLVDRPVQRRASKRRRSCKETGLSPISAEDRGWSLPVAWRDFLPGI